MLIKIAKVLFIWILGIFNLSVCILSIYFYRNGSLAPVNLSNDIEYKDFISIMLTALGVMIAVAAIVLAIAAIWGYNSIKEEAIKAATKEGAKVAGKVAESVARDVASSVATREAFSVHPTETSGADADEIAQVIDIDGNNEAGEPSDDDTH